MHNSSIHVIQKGKKPLKTQIQTACHERMIYHSPSGVGLGYYWIITALTSQLMILGCC